jgi:hypothetical protein
LAARRKGARDPRCKCVNWQVEVIGKRTDQQVREAIELTDRCE